MTALVGAWGPHAVPPNFSQAQRPALVVAANGASRLPIVARGRSGEHSQVVFRARWWRGSQPLAAALWTPPSPVLVLLDVFSCAHRDKQKPHTPLGRRGHAVPPNFGRPEATLVAAGNEAEPARHTAHGVQARARGWYSPGPTASSFQPVAAHLWVAVLWLLVPVVAVALQFGAVYQHRTCAVVGLLTEKWMLRCPICGVPKMYYHALITCAAEVAR
jgi:hypothetical protein